MSALAWWQDTESTTALQTAHALLAVSVAYKILDLYPCSDSVSRQTVAVVPLQL